MQKRIAILSFMAVAAYCFMILSSFADEWDSARLGFWMGYYGGRGEEAMAEEGLNIPKSLHYLALKPESDYREFSSEIQNSKDDSVLSARFSGVVIALPQGFETPREVVHLNFFDGFLSFIMLFVLIALPLKFIRLMLSVKKEMIFNKKNVNRIRSIGIMVILIYIIQIIHVHLNFRINQILFNIPDYIIYRPSTSGTLLVVGTAVLIIAEIVARGLDIKTDQELTI